MNVRKKLLKLLITVIVMLVLGSALSAFSMTAASASADQPSPAPASSQSDASSEDSSNPTCEGVDYNVGSGNCADVVESESHSRSSATSKVVAVNGVSINSEVTVLANILVNGTPPSQQTDCFRTDHALDAWTSYNAAGTTGWHWKTYPKGKKLCRINGAVRDPLCHNQVKIGVPRSNPPKNAISGKVKFVKKLVWQVKAVAKADEKVTSRAAAWCNTATSSAYGSGGGFAVARAVGRASLKGSVISKLLIKVEAKARGDLAAQLGGQSITQVKASVRSSAFAKATSRAYANARCKVPENPEYDECPMIPGNQPPGYVCESSPPTIQASSQVCVKQGETSGIIVATVGNPNPTKDVAQVVIGNQAQTREVQANSQVSFTFTGFAVGTYQVVAKLTSINKSVSTSVTVVQCAPEPTCEDVYGPGYYGDYPDCFKDGTTTPAPPPTTPGPNPPPADPGTPGSQCYSNETGQPVPPNADGTCPPGSS